MMDRIKTRLLIGGPARCGKTTLAHQIAKTSNDFFVPGVDILFRAMLRRGFINRLLPPTQTIRHFLSRARYQDPERRLTENVLDYSKADIDTLLAKITKTSSNPLTGYAEAIDSMALADDKTGWAAFDVHSEFAYHRLRRFISRLQLVVIFREPRESIAAALYWRRTKETGQHSRREFLHFTLLWAMAVHAARKHQRTWPSDVRIETFPRLLSGEALTQLSTLAMHTEPDHSLAANMIHFRYRDGRFTLPDGTEKALLSDRELAEIAALIDPISKSVGIYPPKTNVIRPHAATRLRIYFAIIMAATKLDPAFGASLLNVLESPLGTIRHSIWKIRASIDAFTKTPPANY